MNLNFDKNFLPMIKVLREFKTAVKKEKRKQFKIAVEQNGGFITRYDIDIFDSENNEKREQNFKIVERIVKTLLWIAGGYKICVCGDECLFNRLIATYSRCGERAFDVEFMSVVYEREFEVVNVKEEDFPKESKPSEQMGGRFEGAKIGLDVGGSDIKICAVKEGEVLYSEEIIWHPKINSDYRYHYAEIRKAIKKALAKLPEARAIGVSSAGVCVDDKMMVSALFIKVPKKDFEMTKNIYVNIAKEFNLQLKVANDGDITALAGALEDKKTCVLGLAMGTSEAGGYINEKGGFNGWISELAFVPVDFSPLAMKDEWSGDIGCGVKYFSQDGVIKLADMAGIELKERLTPAEKLKVVQNMLEKGDERAQKIYEDVGTYLGWTLAYYAEFYKIKHVQLLGRVVSGRGGEIIAKKAREIICENFPSLLHIVIEMPDEHSRRVGQSIAASTIV